MVCAYRSVVFERSSDINGVVLGRDRRFTVVGAECVAARHASDLFCVLSVFCERSAGFFRLPVGRHVAGRRLFFSFLRPGRSATGFGAGAPPPVAKSVPAAMEWFRIYFE